MPRKKKEIFDTNRQIEAGQSIVRLDGVGEDQAVQEVLSPEFPTMPDSKAFDIANALREILVGQKVMGQELAEMRAKMAKYDRDEEAWNEDRRNFVEGLSRKADAVRVPDSQRESMQAKASQTIQQIYQKAQMDGALKRKKFEEDIKTMPKVLVTSPGRVYIVGGAPRLEPEVVKIKNKRWILQPGVPTEVPRVVAEELQQRRAVERETAERKNLLARQLEGTAVATEWNSITGKYKSGDTNDPSIQFPL